MDVCRAEETSSNLVEAVYCRVDFVGLSGAELSDCKGTVRNAVGRAGCCVEDRESLSQLEGWR